MDLVLLLAMANPKPDDNSFSWLGLFLALLVIGATHFLIERHCRKQKNTSHHRYYKSQIRYYYTVGIAFLLLAFPFSIIDPFETLGNGYPFAGMVGACAILYLFVASRTSRWMKFLHSSKERHTKKHLILRGDL